MKKTIPNKISTHGYYYVVIAAILWAISSSSSKYLFNSGISPFQLVQLRITISAGFLFIVLFIWRRNLLRIASKDLFYFLFLGAAAMALVQFTYLYTISKINVAAAILLQYLAPAFITLYLVIFEKEKLHKATVIAVFGAILGCYFVVGAYNLNLFALNKVGVLSGILSAVCYAWYSISGEYGMRKYAPLTVVFYSLFFAAITWNILHPPFKALFHAYSPFQWGLIIYIGIFGTVIPFSLYLEGINLIRSTRAAITGTLEPITAAGISYLLLNETLDLLQIAGGILVLASIVLMQFKVQYDDKIPDLIRTKKK